MLRRAMLAVLIAMVVAFGVYWWLTMPAAMAVPAATRAPDLANGKELFNAGGCASCHAVPNQDDRLRLGGGLPLRSPFGTFYVPNISPDPNDGIGRWSESDFVNAVMRGISPDGKHYFPAFPYTSYHLAKVDDVRDLFAYLKTLPAVQGKSRDHDVPFPFDIRRNVGIWKLLFMNTGSFVPDASRSEQWNRGAYLVNAFGHCAECHSPRNALGGIIRSQRFAGGPNPEGEGWVPNITQKGIGTWSEKDIADFLETGDMPEGDSASGAMRPVIKNLAQLTAEDRAAMAAYLKSLPPVDGPTPPKRKEGS
ncbi:MULTISPECIES: c-type cytochrome [unclassified Bradyrhizobium]|uniref:c-type cytochrome n=1 Tax=unclassified Bradyrhizobium TaxID=2631580 RepID=UPI00030B6546|nr:MULTISPECIES: cytochrome c [unclassified Bradyrhizobium]AMA59231.1 alkylated DNA repair protein [Bradyrhizobium sp. CCGE-LA001]KYG98608.1 alkylated DNA repair protein [Bradyrhizobium sp. DOA1]